MTISRLSGRCGARTMPSSSRPERDLPKGQVHLLDTGHFALETHAAEIGELIRNFLEQNLGANLLGVSAS